MRRAATFALISKFCQWTESTPQYVAVQYTHVQSPRMGVERKSAAYASFGDVALLVLFAGLLLAGIWARSRSSASCGDTPELRAVEPQ